MSDYPDLVAVEKLVHQACAEAGFVFTDSAGQELVDREALKLAVYQLMVDQHIVDEPRDMTKDAITQHELYEAIFPRGPGARTHPITKEEEVARNQLRRLLWDFTQTGIRGYVNQRVEVEGLSLVMCEAPVGRNYRSEETGRPTPTTVQGRFLTDDPELIATHSTLPRTHKLVKTAEAVAKHAAMATRRHPELSGTVAQQITGALKQTQAALGPVRSRKLPSAGNPPSLEDGEG